jgi:hypothetical protein
MNDAKLLIEMDGLLIVGLVAQRPTLWLISARRSTSVSRHKYCIHFGLLPVPDIPPSRSASATPPILGGHKGSLSSSIPYIFPLRCFSESLSYYSSRLCATREDALRPGGGSYDNS